MDGYPSVIDLELHFRLSCEISIASIQAGLNLNKEALDGGEKREALQSGWLT